MCIVTCLPCNNSDRKSDSEVSKFSWLACIFIFYFQAQPPLLLLLLLISATELFLVYALKLFNIAAATHDLTHK